MESSHSSKVFTLVCFVNLDVLGWHFRFPQNSVVKPTVERLTWGEQEELHTSPEYGGWNSSGKHFYFLKSQETCHIPILPQSICSWSTHVKWIRPRLMPLEITVVQFPNSSWKLPGDFRVESGKGIVWGGEGPQWIIIPPSKAAISPRWSLYCEDQL